MRVTRFMSRAEWEAFEWGCVSYDNTIAKVVDKCIPFQGEEYREIKEFVNLLKSIVL